MGDQPYTGDGKTTTDRKVRITMRELEYKGKHQTERITRQPGSLPPVQRWERKDKH